MAITERCVAPPSQMHVESKGKLSSQLRGIKASDAIKAFEKAGGIRRIGKGDHINIKMPNGRIITLRGKDQVKVGRLTDAIREAGLTVEEFLRLLK
jgi:predicted RNA binding protein YcfA (HicA-like mRNA interferase family)